MPQTYDIDQQRQSFDTSTLVRLRDACRKTPEFRGDAAALLANDVVTAWLLGRGADVRAPLSMLLQWFEEANAANEQSGESPHLHAALRNEAHGLALWFSNGLSSKLPYQISVKHYERHFDIEGITHGSLEDYLASCVQCGEFARGAALYEKVGGKTGIADSKIQYALHLGYWLCKNGREGSIAAQQCEVIGTRVLRASLQERWFVRGQCVRGATWLKIVAEFARWKLSPQGVMRHALQFLPASVG